MGSFSIWHWLIVLIIFSPVLIGLATMGLQKKVILKHSPSGLVKNGYLAGVNYPGLPTTTILAG